MTMKVMPLLVGLLLAAGCAAVEPFDAPYALVEVGPISAARKELPVIVNAVDGDYLLNPRSGPIKPGKHLLEVQFSTQDGPYWKRDGMIASSDPGSAAWISRASATGVPASCSPTMPSAGQRISFRRWVRLILGMAWQQPA